MSPGDVVALPQDIIGIRPSQAVRFNRDRAELVVFPPKRTAISGYLPHCWGIAGMARPFWG
jgi:hypothetical protein